MDDDDEGDVGERGVIGLRAGVSAGDDIRWRFTFANERMEKKSVITGITYDHAGKHTT